MSAAKKWRAAELYALIEAKYPSPQYAVLPEVTNATGFDAKRRADAMVMGLWPSRGVDLHGMEIKVSRSDLRRELDNPQKAEAHAQFCDYWWLVCPAGLATVEELPEKWGLLEATPLRRKASDGRTHHLKIRKKAVELTPLPLNRAMLASMLRRVVEYRSDATVLEDVRRKAHTSGWEDGLAHNQESVDRITKAHEELIERVGEFEKASGLRIGARWYSHLDPGELGKAVKAIMAGDEAMRKRLEHFARLAKTMLEECEAAAKAMGTTDHPEQLGLEPELADYISRLVGILGAVRDVMANDGVMWLNLGDTYVAGRSGGVGTSSLTSHRNHDAARRARRGATHRKAVGLKPKDLCGVPWRVALALQDDGWWLRSEVIWQKPNAMPESVRDRPTRDHEHVFLLSKSASYYYDADAIRTPLKPKTLTAHGSPARRAKAGDDSSKSANWAASSSARRVAKRDADGKLVGANARTVWSIPQEPWPDAHTSTFPTKLARRCILAGCPAGGLVLDPFAGTGTTLAVAVEAGRRAVGIEINPALCPQIERRMSGLQMPMFPGVARG